MNKIFMPMLAAACGLLLAAGAAAQTGGQESQSTPAPSPQGKPAQTQPPDQQQQQQPPQQQQQQQQAATQQPKQDPYTQQIMEPDKFKELKVKDAQGKEVGTIDQVVLDAKEGRIGYLLVTTGSTMGMGGRQVIVPWSAVQYQSPQQQQQQAQQQGGTEPFLALSVPKDQLMEAPQGEIQENLDRKQGELIHQYYGVSPYWEEGQSQQQQQGPQQQQPQAQPQPPQPPGQQMQ